MSASLYVYCSCHEDTLLLFLGEGKWTHIPESVDGNREVWLCSADGQQTGVQCRLPVDGDPCT